MARLTAAAAIFAGSRLTESFSLAAARKSDRSRWPRSSSPSLARSSDGADQSARSCKRARVLLAEPVGLGGGDRQHPGDQAVHDQRHRHQRQRGTGQRPDRTARGRARLAPGRVFPGDGAYP